MPERKLHTFRHRDTGATISFYAVGKPSRAMKDAEFRRQGLSKLAEEKAKTEEAVKQSGFVGAHPTTAKFAAGLYGLSKGVGEAGMAGLEMPGRMFMAPYEAYQQGKELLTSEQPGEVAKGMIPFREPISKVISPKTPEERYQGLGELAGELGTYAAFGGAGRTPRPIQPEVIQPTPRPFRPAGLLPQTIDMPPEVIPTLPSRPPLALPPAPPEVPIPGGVMRPGPADASFVRGVPAEIPPKVMVQRPDIAAKVREQFTEPLVTPPPEDFVRARAGVSRAGEEIRPYVTPPEIPSTPRPATMRDKLTRFNEERLAKAEQEPLEAEFNKPLEPLQEAFNPNKAIKDAGATPRGESEGLTYFDDPQTKSTLALRTEEVTLEAVAAKLEESRAKFEKPNIFQGMSQEDIKALAKLGDKDAQALLVKEPKFVEPDIVPVDEMARGKTQSNIDFAERENIPYRIIGKEPMIEAETFPVGKEPTVKRVIEGQEREVKVLPPGPIPEEPIEFGRSLEKTKATIEKSKRRSESILRRLAKEEGGAFTPEGIRDFFRKSDKKVGDEKDYINYLKGKTARGIAFTKEEQQTAKSLKERYGYNPINMMDEPSGLGRLKASVSSTDQYLDTNPWTKPIADIIRNAEVSKNIWKVQAKDMLSQIKKQSSGTKAEDLFDILNGDVRPINAAEAKTAEILRGFLDALYDFQKSKNATTYSGKPLKYLNDYITNMWRDASFSDNFRASVEAILGGPEGRAAFRGRFKQAFVGEEIPVRGEPGEKTYAGGTGVPGSPYIEKRKGGIKILERDVWKVLVRYIEAAAKVSFDKPAVLKTREVLAKLPAGFNKDLATWYVRNYSGYESLPYLEGFFRRLDRGMAGRGAASVLWGNTRLQALHLARIITQIWPEQGYFALEGLGRFIANPPQSWSATRKAGLLPQSETPWNLKTKGDIFATIGNFADLGNSLAKAVALQGNLAKFGDLRKAINETARQEGMVTPARTIALLAKAPRSLIQFKFWFAKYVENASRATAEFAKQPNIANIARLARYASSIALAIYLTKKLGITLWHAGFRTLELFGSTNIAMVEETIRNLSKGDWPEAAKTIIKYQTPGAQSIPRELGERGPSFLHQEPPKKTKGGEKYSVESPEKSREKYAP